ncbi:acyltransferase family protein [Brevibacterium moorei]|uniref:acyltransferase family protein n=1 Tax=Brevibacterium moorei TaxID=2968457 RepID=UPI00211B8546|nr:acyltransferase [Brevibacterium sp. 68QC2CO]MCQ9385194.1 acyltransferase [Brevibacterium sp. 68QC2CO]
MSSPAAAPPRFYLLDLLRLCAAASVLAYHYTGRNHKNWQASTEQTFGALSHVTAYGALGVQLFFIISGFVILMSAQGRSVQSFIAGRISRLYPAYWVSVLLGSLLGPLLAPEVFKNPSAVKTLANLTMMQNALGQKDVDGVYWTLWIELLFYVMIAIFLVVGMTQTRIMAFIIVWPLVGAMAQQGDAGLVVELLQPGYAGLFTGGMALFLIHQYGHSLLRWLLVVYSVCFAVPQTIAVNFHPMVQKYVGRDMSDTVCAALVILCFALVALVTVTPLRHKGWGWMTYAGALTYPLYLFHQYWGWTVIRTLSPTLNKWLVVAVATAVCVALAIIVERWVERPLRRRLRSTLKRGFAEVTAASHSRGEPGAPRH